MANLSTDAIHWDNEVTLREFAESFDGPRLVHLRCEIPGGEGDGSLVELGTDVDTDALFLAYSRRLRTKVYGQPLVRDGGTSEYVLSGSVLEIPKDYPGWFSVIPDGDYELQPFASMKQVADSDCRHFLTVSSLVGFLTSTDADDNICLVAEKKVYPGEVLQVTGVASRKWKVKASSKPSSTPETLLLKCVNKTKCEISFPLAHPGRFYAIAEPRAEGNDSNSRKTDCIYTISEIADVFRLPLNVSLVFGWTPWLRDGGNFGGQLRLLGVDRPETLVAYNFVRYKAIFVELPVGLSVKVRRATDSSQYEASAAYKAALATCRKRTFPFVSSIKSASLVRYAARRGRAQESTENGTGKTGENETRDTTGEEESDGAKRSGFLPMAINMDGFNPLRLFPPLDYETAPDIGALSFTDAKNNVDQGATEDGFDFSFHFSVPSGYKLSKDTCGRHSMKPSKVEQETPPLDRKRDLRESRDKEVRSREAVC